MRCNRFQAVLTLAAAVVLVLTASAGAAVMTSSSTAPTVDGADIAWLGTPTSSDKWWPDPATTYGNPGKTVGQSFTTGSEDVLLNAFTLNVTSATQPTKTYTIRVGSVSGTTFNVFHTETATQAFVTADNDYWTWTFDTPVPLSANTLYGVDVGLTSSTSAWQTGIPYVWYDSDSATYPSGTRFRTGTEGYGVGDSLMGQTSGDRVFHLDMEAAGGGPGPGPGPVSVPIADVTGSHGGNYAGTLVKMIDGSGMTQPDLSDPSTWTATSNAYPDEWQTTAFLTGATNGKIAWTAFDLGSSTADLEDLYLWNVREAADRGTDTYNVYYADSPTMALPPAPPTNTLGSDYDFASGGWTLLNTSGVLSLPQRGAAPDPADAVVDLGGISARYIGLEILTNHGSTFGNGRVGLAEVAVTQGQGGGPGPETPPYEAAVLADDPVIYYRLNEATGSTDVSNIGSAGAAYNGTTSGNLTFGVASAESGLGTALDLSGANDGYIVAANNLGVFLNDTASMEFWIRTNQSGGGSGWNNPALVGRDQGGGSNDIWWGINENGEIGINMGNLPIEVTTGPINNDEWHYVLLTRDSSTGELNVYLDGDPNPVDTAIGSTGVFGISYTSIGRNESGGVIDAMIDEVAVYDYVLTGEQGQAHFAAASAAAAVPEPSTFVLAALGLLGLAFCAPRRRRLP